MNKIMNKYINKNNNRYKNNYNAILIKEGKNKDIIPLGKLKFADTYFSRLIGLMFKKKLEYILALKPNQCNIISSAIHTMFMRVDIDVIFLNENKKVLEIATISPWKIYIPKKASKYILELQKGIIKKYDINRGDYLDFITIIA